MLCDMLDLCKNADAIVVASSHAVEHDALEACKRFKKIYEVGVLLQPRGWEKGTATLTDEHQRAFLDKQKPKTVLYISFGYATRLRLPLFCSC
jgi:hypothetical protein